MFKLATPDPWLLVAESASGSSGGGGGEQTNWTLDEERRLISASQDSRFGFHLTTLMDFLFAAILLRRTDQHSAGAERDTVKNRLCYDFRLGQLAAGGHLRISGARARLICGSICALATYCWLTVAASLRLVVRHDALVARMRPALRNGSLPFSVAGGAGAGAVQCARRQDIVYGSGFSWPQLAEANEQLNRAGVATRAQLGVGIFVIGILLMLPINFFALATLNIKLNGHRVRLDWVAFLYEPIGERRRLMADARVCIASLVSAVAGGPSREVRGRVEFASSLARLQRGQLVRPVVVSSQWHRNVSHTCKLISLAIVTFVLFGNHAFLLLIFGLDLWARAQDRVAQAACLRGHPAATLLRPRTYLHELISLPELLERRSFAGVLLDELRRACTRQMIFYALKLSVLVTCVTMWTSLWAIVYVHGYLDKISWLMQIRAQLASCHRQLAASLPVSEPSRSSFHSTRASSHSSRPRLRRTCTCDTSICETPTCDISTCTPCATCKTCATSGPTSSSAALSSSEANKILEQLAIVYVNYALFRRQYKLFRWFSNFCIFNITAFALAGLLILYLVASRIGNPVQFRWISLALAAGLLLCMNVYLVVSSLDSRMIESVVRQLGRLLAIAAHYPQLARKPALALWRRQLLSEQELSMLAAMRILTLHVSYRRIIAFNVQLLVVLLLIWRALTPR